MAQASIQHRSTARTAQKRIPSPAEVYKTYAHECMAHGQRGAYRRTGDRYGRSDEWARKAILKYNEQRQAETTRPQIPAHELIYEPAPGEVEYAQERAANAAKNANSALLAELLLPSEMPTATVEVDIVQAEAPIANQDECQPIERAAVVYDVFANRQPVDGRARHQEALIVSRIAIAVAALLTFGVLLLASRSTLAGLGLLPAMLLGWHLAAEGRRVARRIV